MALLKPQDKIAHEIHEAAAREYLAENKRRRFGRGRYLGMSQLGEACDLVLWYDFRSFTRKPFDGRVALIFDDGNHYEEKVIKYLKLAGYKVDHAGFGDQLEFSWHNGLCRGHADGVIHGVTSRPHILEVKSANRKRFDAFRGFGIQKTVPAYYCQVQCYMMCSGLERALVVVYCKDSSEIYTERIHFVNQEAEALKQRAYTVITANEAPEKPFQEDSSTASGATTGCTVGQKRGQSWRMTELGGRAGTCGGRAFATGASPPTIPLRSRPGVSVAKSGPISSTRRSVPTS